MSADPWITLACSIGILAAVAVSYKYLEPNPYDWKHHVIYWIIAILIIVLLPSSVSSYIFSSLTVTLVGAVYPVYRATKAVCTPDAIDAVAILVGTVYPFVCSVTAAATEEIDDDTYWLTYWAVYGCLFLIMDFLETWIGWIPGFYTLIIFSTVYLMLPMFRGADKVFR